MRTFTAYIQYDPETESYVGIVPGLPGAHSVGDTLDELQVNLKEVLDLVVEESLFNDPIFSMYAHKRAAQSGENPAEVAAQIDRNTFYEMVYALHKRFMAGEFSLGYMAQQLGITKPDLYHLLDAMDLKVANV